MKHFSKAPFPQEKYGLTCSLQFSPVCCQKLQSQLQFFLKFTIPVTITKTASCLLLDLFANCSTSRLQTKRKAKYSSAISQSFIAKLAGTLRELQHEQVASEAFPSLDSYRKWTRRPGPSRGCRGCTSTARALETAPALAP